MKVLVFSDTHLSETFEETKYQYLERIIAAANQVIINGDFWDGAVIKFDAFLQSDWKKLFPLLKKKKAIYIYGNHDKKVWSDKRVNLFSVKQLDRYLLESGDKKFVVEHGHRFAPVTGRPNDDPMDLAFLEHVFALVIFVIMKTGFYQTLFKHFNNNLKRSIAKEAKPGEIYVCGHTHCQEFDPDHHLIDTGINTYGYGQYIYIEDGEVTVGNERYGV